ncbi:MAG: ribosome maturation factor RimM [Candidatus Neomarinimicrobiota bacterium]
MARDTSDRNVFTIGTVLKGHGLKGEVKIDPLIDDMELLDGVQSVIATYPDGRVRELELDHVQAHSGKVLLAFKGIKDRNGADALRGVELSISREDLPPLEEGEYYLGDLIGYTVVSEDDTVTGRVQEVWDLPAHEVLQVSHGEREVLIPLIDDVIKEIDHSKRRIVIIPMEGLLD